jgi:CxxC-x17-CxxC domain-containing protein
MHENTLKNKLYFDLVRKHLSNSLITTQFYKFQKDMSYDREREMFDAKCGDCGNDCQIPFKPKEDRPVYCRECFQNHKN